jgi:hypothetical protein
MYDGYVHFVYLELLLSCYSINFFQNQFGKVLFMIEEMFICAEILSKYMWSKRDKITKF